jgi:hypothetical protein
LATSTLLIFLLFLFLVAILELVSAYKSGAQFQKQTLPFTLPYRALPSVLTQQPQSQSRKQHEEIQKNNPKPLQRPFLKYTKRGGEEGTRKKTKKPENRKLSEQVQQFRNQGTQKQNAKSRNGCTRTHRQATTKTTTDFRRKGQATRPILGTL